MPLCIEMASYFPFFFFFWHFPPLNMPFQKDLKQEFSELVTGDIVSFFVDTAERHTYVSDPLV